MVGSGEDRLVDGEVKLDGMNVLQREVSNIVEMVELVQNGFLPKDEGCSKKLILELPRFEAIEDVLWYVDTAWDSRPRLVVPRLLQRQLLAEAHAGPFGGHFAARGM